MARAQYLLLVILTIVPALAGGILSNWLLTTRTAIAQQPDRLRWVDSPAFESYIPTRMEWIRVELLLLLSIDAYRFKDDRYRIDIINPEHEPEMLIIRARYLPTADLMALKEVAESATSKAIELVEKHGWENWVKIRKDMKMVSNLKTTQGK